MTKGLETSFAGLKLKNPVIVSSSGLTNSVEKNRGWEEAGAAAVVLKSLFEEQILLENDACRQGMHPEEADYLAFYQREHGLSDYIDLVKGSKEACSIPVIASINCSTTADWMEFAKRIEEAGADALELNIMAVRGDIDYAYGAFEQQHVEILRRVKQCIQIPVIVKLGSRFTNSVAMAHQLFSHGASGVVLYNRMYAPDINIHSLTYTGGEVLNAPGALSEVLRGVGLVSSRVPQLSLAASGGVADGAALVKVLLAGASAAEVCTALYRHGPSHVWQMLEFAGEWMERMGFERVEEFRGLMNAEREGGAEAFERTQFFKYFGLRNA